MRREIRVEALIVALIGVAQVVVLSNVTAFALVSHFTRCLSSRLCLYQQPCLYYDRKRVSKRNGEK